MPATNVNWPTPLTRLNPWYPGQMGVPGTDSETGLRLNTEGCVFWVDPNHVDANDNRDGTNPTSPLATVEAAIAKCEAYRGDTIAVMHNGFWTYGDTTEDHVLPIQETVTIDVPGIRLVGVSPGTLGVPWEPDADDGVCITVDALDVTIEGFNFWNGTYTGGTGILTEWDGPPYGENVHIRHCFFYSDLDYGIRMDFSWNNTVEDCYFQAVGIAAIDNPGTFGDPDYLTIRNCIFQENVADINLADTDFVLIEGCRFLDTSAAISILGGAYATILNNTIEGDGGGTNNYINLTGSGNCLVCGNCMACTIAQYDTTCSDATSGSWGGNSCDNGFTTAAPT